LKLVSEIKKLEEKGDVLISDLENGEKQIKLNNDKALNDYTQLIRPLDSLERLKSYIPRSLLILMVSQWDTFFVNFTKNLILKKPILMKKIVGSVKYDDLLKYETMENLREYIVDQELEDTMRKSHNDQINWLAAKTDIKLMEQIDQWKFFIEITERRNACVHNDGKISKIYLQNCESMGITTAKNNQLGLEFKINSIYLIDACNYLISTACKLVHTVWRKQFPEDLDNSIRNIVDLTVELIDRGYYESAIEICDFAINWRAEISELRRIYLILNKAQSLKWLGRNEEMQILLRTVIVPDKTWSC
jgi:hypothetical protein